MWFDISIESWRKGRSTRGYNIDYLGLGGLSTCNQRAVMSCCPPVGACLELELEARRASTTDTLEEARRVWMERQGGRGEW